nr:S-layer homology domain-containing protein [Paenibacillus sp. MSJ-34]
MVTNRTFKRVYCFAMALWIAVAGSLSFGAGSPAHADSESAGNMEIEGSQASSLYSLSDNWRIQSSAVATEDGSAVSASGYNTDGWFATKVPNTVLGALIEAGDIEDPFIRDRIAYIDEDRFRVPWWYRTEFTLPASEQGKTILLNFEGIGYKADIWVNGRKIADKQDIVGSFRAYELDITDEVVCDGTTVNTIAVEVTRSDYGKDFSIYWVDWVPRPPDNNMGLWRDVFIRTNGPVTTRNPFVTSKVDADLAAAHLNAYAELSNYSDAPVSGTVTATVIDPSGAVAATLSQAVTLEAGVRNQEVAFRADEYPELRMNHPQLWWPKEMGGQPMYTIEFRFADGNDAVSDSVTQRFGIREVTTEMNVSPSTKTKPPLKDMVQFYVNHKPVLIKAGGYSPTDLFLRRNMETNRAIVQYLEEMGLNAIRDEGIFFDDRLIDLLDEAGVMYMGGWTCCSRWQQPAAYSDEELRIASDSLDSQLRALRAHPSIIAWMNGSDNPPSYKDDMPSGGTLERGKLVEQTFFDLEHRMHWDEYGAIISSGSAKVAELTGTVSGMHMDASYDYAPPAMFFEDMDLGGAFGFTSEAGPGPSIPIVETMKKILPENALWPYNVGGDNYQQWNYHNARSSFRDLSKFNLALDNHYGESHHLEEYNIKAQVQQYDAQRAQFEAVSANKYTKATGWVQWMLNNAWPSMFWNMFDFYLNPNGSYFGAKKANEPLHIMFDYASKEVKIINGTQRDYSGLQAKVQIYNLDGSNVYDREFDHVAVSPDGASPTAGGEPRTIGYQTIRFNGKIEDAYGITVLDRIREEELAVSPVYFLRLELRDADGGLVSINSYAQSTKKDVMRYQNHGWNYTPQDQFADFTHLQELDPVELQIVGAPAAVTEGQEQVLTYTVKNNGASIAYAVFARIKKGEGGDPIAPVRMEDNYFMLLPGEERTLTARYNVSDLGTAAPVIEVDCYNNLTTKQRPTPTTANLALGKTATASTTQGSNSAEKALDSSVYTKWQSSTNASGGADPQWFKVDLGEPASFDTAIVRWDYANYARDLTVEVSDNDADWETVYTGTNSNGSAVSDIRFAPVTKRYIKLTMSGKRPAGPQIGSGGTGQGVTGLGATPASTSFNIASFEVYGPVLGKDASLSMITVNGERLVGFEPTRLRYGLALPEDTTEVPIVDATASDPKAKVEIVPAASVPGVTYIAVTAEDALTMQTYELHFTFDSGTPGNDDATLSGIQVNGAELAGFEPGKLEYEVELPPGTTDVPSVTATVYDPKASAQIIDATGLPGMTQIVVTAEDNETVQTYKIHFTVNSDVPKSDDATLSGILVNGAPLAGFHRDILDYAVKLPAGTKDAPLVAATSTDPKAKVELTQAAGATGKAVIAVTAEDGVTKRTYTVSFTVKSADSGPGGGSSSGGGSATKPNPSPGPAPDKDIDPKAPGTTAKLTEEQLKQGKGGKVTVEVEPTVKEVQLPPNAGELLGRNALEVKKGSLTVGIPADLFQQLARGLSADELKEAAISLQLIALGQAEARKLISASGQAANADIRLAGDVYELALTMKRSSGQTSELSAFAKPVSIRIKIETAIDPKRAGIFRIDEDGTLEYVGGEYADGTMVAEIGRFGKYAVLEVNKHFADVASTHWAGGAIKELAAKQILNGTSAALFEPNRSITRAEFASLLVKALKLTKKGGIAFADVSAEAWYADAVSIAKEAGIVKGRDAERFDPNGLITREEMTAMLTRAYEIRYGKIGSGQSGQSGQPGQSGEPSSATFADDSQISPWAAEYIRAAAALGLVQGRADRQFVPQGATTRAEAAQVVYHLLNR